MKNVLLSTDVYKLGHMLQYAPGCEKVYSYLCARSDKTFKETVFFGLQYYLKKYLCKPITMEMADEWIKYYEMMLGECPIESINKIRALANLGYWPLQIKAVPEGAIVPVKNTLMTITNTHPDFYWCVGFVESLLLKLWYTITVATCCNHYRKLVDKFFDETVDEDMHLLKDFTVHDFGYRGDSSEEGAAISGVAHLLSFLGSDTVPALPCAIEYYNADTTKPIMLSVPASEHSVMCSFGQEDELAAFKNMLRLYPKGIVSIVSDTFDVYRVLTEFAEVLKEDILNRDGKVVFRPDCYDDKTEILTDKGWLLFKVLRPEDKVLQYNVDGTLELVTPSKIIEHEYDGDMYKVTNEQHHVDLLVTPNHRMVFRDKNGKIGVQEISSIKYSKHHCLCAGLKLGTKNNLTPYERLLIAFQADGSFQNYNSHHDFKDRMVVVFNFKKQRKIERLKNICESGGFEYKIIPTAKRPGYNRVFVTFTECPYKTFEWINLKEISYNWAKQFIDEVSHWDSHILEANKNQIEYSTAIKLNAEIVQTIAALAGYRVKFTEKEDLRKPEFNTRYRVHITFKDFIDGQVVKKEIINYKGKVYCVTVPSGMIMVKRNNQISISGNSGNPEHIVCGDPNAPEGSNQRKGCLRLLDEKFGSTLNNKGYKVLNPKVGLIYGDGEYYERYERQLKQMKEMGYAASNLVIGVGGILRNYTRDTLGFAIKATYVEVNGESRPIEKDPITDKGKKSHKGLLCLIKDLTGNYYTISCKDKELENVGELNVIFRNGKLLKEYLLSEIRERVKNNEK